MNNNPFDISVVQIIDRLPPDFSQITTTTIPVNTVLIEEFIEEASSDIINLLKQAGITSYNDTIKAQVRRAITTYAVSESLKAFGLIGDQYRAMREEYDAIYDSFKKPERLGQGTRAVGRSVARTSRSRYLNKDLKF